MIQINAVRRKVRQKEMPSMQGIRRNMQHKLIHEVNLKRRAQYALRAETSNKSLREQRGANVEGVNKRLREDYEAHAGTCGLKDDVNMKHHLESQMRGDTTGTSLQSWCGIVMHSALL